MQAAGGCSRHSYPAGCARGRCRSNTHGRWRARLGKLFGMLPCLATGCESHPSNLTRDAHRPQGIHHYNEPSIARQSCWRHLHMSSMFWCKSCSQLVICVCCCVLVCSLVCLLCASRLQWKYKSIFWESDSFLHYRHKLCVTLNTKFCFLLISPKHHQTLPFPTSLFYHAKYHTKLCAIWHNCVIGPYFTTFTNDISGLLSRFYRPNSQKHIIEEERRENIIMGL